MKTNTLKYEGVCGEDIEDAVVAMRNLSLKHRIRIETTWNDVALSVPPCATLAEIASIVVYYRLSLR